MLRKQDWAPLDRLTPDDRLCMMLDSPDYGHEFINIMHEAEQLCQTFRKLPLMRGSSTWRSKYTQPPKVKLVAASDAVAELSKWLQEIRRTCPRAAKRLGLEKQRVDGKVRSGNGADHGK